MPRKGEVPKRDSIPDPKYTEAPIDVRKRITKFMNTVMSAGKKSTAEQIVYGAFDLVEQRSKQEAVKIFDLALTNVKPKLEVKSRRVGGSTYQVPVDVRPERSTRSEEHTSELQSHVNLVCRLLLEKKKNTLIAYLYPRHVRYVSAD